MPQNSQKWKSFIPFLGMPASIQTVLFGILGCLSADTTASALPMRCPGGDYGGGSIPPLAQFVLLTPSGAVQGNLNNALNSVTWYTLRHHAVQPRPSRPSPHRGMYVVPTPSAQGRYHKWPSPIWPSVTPSPKTSPTSCGGRQRPLPPGWDQWQPPLAV